MFSKFFPSFKVSPLIASAAIAGAALAMVGMGTSKASAAIITGSFSDPAAAANTYNNSSATPIDISNGTAAWAYYGTPSYTDSLNKARFSTLSDNSGSLGTSDGYMLLTASNAPAASTNFVFNSNVSFTTNLIAPSETLTVYLVSYSTGCNISATLAGDGSYTANDVVLPYSPPDDNSAGTGHGYGVLTLDITGGNVGELLSFSDSNYSPSTNPNPNPNANVGVQAASVVATAVPDPATLGLVGVGAIGLLLLSKRRHA